MPRYQARKSSPSPGVSNHGASQCSSARRFVQSKRVRPRRGEGGCLCGSSAGRTLVLYGLVARVTTIADAYNRHRARGMVEATPMMW